MRNTLYSILLTLGIAALFVGCRPYDVRQEIFLTIDNLPMIQDTISGLVKDAVEPQATFYGTVKDKSSGVKESGVTVKIVGSDSPEGSTITGEDGSWEITMPVIPQKNDPDIMRFCVVLEKEGATSFPISAYFDNKNVVDLLSENFSNNYMVAAVYYTSLTWGNMYAKIKVDLEIPMSN